MSTSLLVTIILMVAVLAVTIGVWARHRRVRPLVGGLGLMLIPLGLYLLGVMDLVVNGVGSIIAWLQRTWWTDTMTWGASLAGAGVLLVVISGFLPSGPKEQAASATRTSAASGAGDTRGGALPQRPPAGTSTPGVQARPTRPAGKAGKESLDDEDLEIEALLKKRGIM